MLSQLWLHVRIDIPEEAADYKSQIASRYSWDGIPITTLQPTGDKKRRQPSTGMRSTMVIAVCLSPAQPPALLEVDGDANRHRRQGAGRLRELVESYLRLPVLEEESLFIIGSGSLFLVPN